MSKEIQIKGVIVFDVNRKAYDIKTFLTKDNFSDGVFQTEYSTYVYIAEHTIEMDSPVDLDLVSPQLKALDAKEKELRFEFNQSLNHIKVQRENLLSIEYTGSEK